MNALIILLALCSHPRAEKVYAPPATVQQQAMVEALGDPSFAKRQATQIFLGFNIFDNLRALKKGLSHKDAEVRYRCKLILDEYYRFDKTQLRSIWYLPSDLRFVVKDGFSVDVALEYYIEAYELYVGEGKSKEKDVWYEHPYVSCLASELYLVDMLIQEVKKTHVYELMDEMRLNTMYYRHLNGSQDNYVYYNMFGMGIPQRIIPPGPMLKRGCDALLNDFDPGRDACFDD